MKTNRTIAPRWLALVALLLMAGLAGATQLASSARQHQDQDLRHTQTNQLRSHGNTAFNPGEKLKYRIRYGILTAGSVDLQVSPQLQTLEGRPAYHLSGVARTASSFEWFYKVHDTFDTYVDQDALAPWQYKRVINEGSFHWEDNVKFDHTNKKLRSVKGEYDMPMYTQDMMSAIYFFRTLDLQKLPNGTIYRIPTFMDDGVYQVGMKILGRETIKTNVGKVRCIKVTPLVTVGEVLKGEEDLIIWLSDDANKIPVMIQSPLVVGSMKAELVEFSGLRNPFDAKH